MDNLADIEIEHHVEALAPSVGEYMLAAYQVYAKGADAASAASKSGLDPKLVERWAAYLKPAGEVRAHLAEWDNATDANRAAVAQKFEDSFNETLAAWYKKLRHWRKRRIGRPKRSPWAFRRSPISRRERTASSSKRPWRRTLRSRSAPRKTRRRC
ncbi:MAG: hypothetical protein R2748_20290 [Bryobacterales bacterium]